jgi:hypothetical protein
MKADRDPVRWGDPDSDAPGELAAAIRKLRTGRGSAQQVEALGRRLAPQLGTPVVAGGVAAVSPWIKAAGALLLSAAIGFYALTRMAQTEPTAAAPPPAKPATAAEDTSPAPAIATPTPVPGTPSAQPVPEPVLQQQPRPRAASKPRATPATDTTANAPAPSPVPERELVLLQRSQSALDRDPSAALSLAEQHARDYPHGVFAQEREILAIEALLKLKQRPAALTRAEQFLRHHPESPHSTRVRALLERSRLLAPATIEDRPAHSEDVPVRDGGRLDPN